MRYSIYMRYIFFIVTLLICGQTLAQDDEPWYAVSYRIGDSLKLVLKTQQLTEKEKLEVYSQLAMSVYGGLEQDSVIFYGTKALALAKKFGEYERKTEIYRYLGVAYCFTSNYDTARILFNEAIELAIERNDKRSETGTLALIAFAYAKEAKYNTAVDYYLKILKIAESEDWTDDRVRALNNLSEINRRMGNTTIAMQYLKESEDILNNLSQSPSDRGLYEWRMPHVYNEYASNYIAQGDLDKATWYLLKSDSINTFAAVNKCQTKSLLTTIYIQRGDYDLAMQYAQESYHQANFLKDRKLYTDARKSISDVYLAQKRYPEAEAEALKAWMADSTDIDVSRYLAENIALANIYMNNTEKAAYYFKRYSELNKQYSDKSFQTNLSDLGIKYEIDKKEMRIVSLEKERQLSLWLGVAGILLVFALIIVLWQTIKNAKKEKQLIATYSVMDGEMIERTRLARDLHDRLSGNLSAVKIELNNTESLLKISNKLDGCIDEIRRVAHNLMPTSLQYGIKTALEDFAVQFPNVHFHFFGEDNRFEERAEFILYCCANELVNNSLKHSGAESINLQLVQDEKHATLTVQDDGKGYNEKTIRKGLGLRNIYDRITSCNGKIDVFSSSKGTETTIELKIK